MGARGPRNIPPRGNARPHMRIPPARTRRTTRAAPTSIPAQSAQISRWGGRAPTRVRRPRPLRRPWGRLPCAGNPPSEQWRTGYSARRDPRYIRENSALHCLAPEIPVVAGWTLPYTCMRHRYLRVTYGHAYRIMRQVGSRHKTIGGKWQKLSFLKRAFLGMMI